jgi:hypothetical protein
VLRYSAKRKRGKAYGKILFLSLIRGEPSGLSRVRGRRLWQRSPQPEPEKSGLKIKLRDDSLRKQIDNVPVDECRLSDSD